MGEERWGATTTAITTITPSPHLHIHPILHPRIPSPLPPHPLLPPHHHYHPPVSPHYHPLILAPHDHPILITALYTSTPHSHPTICITIHSTSTITSPLPTPATPSVHPQNIPHHHLPVTPLFQPYHPHRHFKLPHNTAHYCIHLNHPPQHTTTPPPVALIPYSHSTTHAYHSSSNTPNQLPSPQTPYLTTLTPPL